MCGLKLHKGSFWFSYWSPLHIHSQMWPGHGWHECCLVIESWSGLPQARMGDGLRTELVGRGQPPASNGPLHPTQKHQVCGQLMVFILHTVQKVTVALCTCTSWSCLCPEPHRLPTLECDQSYYHSSPYIPSCLTPGITEDRKFPSLCLLWDFF